MNGTLPCPWCLAGPWVFLLPRRRDSSCWLAMRKGWQGSDCGGDLDGPGPLFGELSPADRRGPASGDGEDTKEYRRPAAGLVG